VWLELEDDLEFSSAKRSAEQLMSITVLLISANLKVCEEAFHRFVKCHTVFNEFISLEIILKIRRSEAMPIDHGPILSRS